MTTTDQHGSQSAPGHEAMVVVDDIGAHLHVRPARGREDHRYDRGAIAAAMAAVLTRALEPDIRVDADGTVRCHIEALTEHGFAPDDATGAIPRRAGALWEEIIVAHVDLGHVERAGQRTHVQVAAARTPPGQPVAVTVNDTAVEFVDPERVDPALDARWERAYGIGAPAAIRTAAGIAAAGGAGRCGEVRAVRAPVTWPPARSPWTATTPLTTT